MEVVIVEDHPLTSQGLRSHLEQNGCRVRAAVPSVEQIAGVTADTPSVAVCDLRLVGRSGTDAVAFLVDLAIPVLAMSGVATPDEMLDVIAAGASGYLPKTARPASFVGALRTIGGGSRYLSAELAHHLLVDVEHRPLGARELPASAVRLLRDVERGDRAEESAARRGVSADGVHRDLEAIWEASRHRRVRYRPTPRELEILRMASEGLTHRELAARLHVSVHTVPDLLEGVKAKYMATHPDADRASAPLAVARRWARELWLT